MQVANFISAKKQLLSMFGITDDFYVKPCVDKHWEINKEDDLPLLKYDEGESRQTCVIVKKDNTPMIFKKNNFTLVVALDCVKVCFVFDNSNYKGKMNF